MHHARSTFGEGDTLVLASRAEELARASRQAVHYRVVERVVVVTLGQELLGIPARAMNGVFRAVPFTPMVGAPRWFAGVAHVRGELISVVHLSHWFGQPNGSGSQLLAVITGARGSLGVLVGGVIAFREIREDEISEALTCQMQRTCRVGRAVTRDLVTVLDVQALLSDADASITSGSTRTDRGMDRP